MNSVLTIYCRKSKLAALILGIMVATLSCDNSGQSTADNTVLVENANANIKFSQDSVQSKPGVDVVVSVLMSDMPTTEGGGLSLTYDSSLVSVSAVQINQDVWKFVNKNGVIDNAAGKISDVLFSSYSAVPGNSEIATITLHPLKPGTGQIVLSGSTINPFASNGEALSVSFGRMQLITTAN